MPKLRIRVHERNDRKIEVVHYGTPVKVGVDDLLQGLSRCNNGNLWCFKVLGFDSDYIKEHAPGSRGDSVKIIAGIGEDTVRKALQDVIDNPDEYSEFLDKVVGWTDAKTNAVADVLQDKAEKSAEELRRNGYAVEIATSDSGIPVTVYFAKKSDSPSCVGRGVPDSEVGTYTTQMRNYLMDCESGFTVYSRYGSSQPVDLTSCSRRLSDKLGALTISDFKQVDPDYVAKGADWKIIGSGKYGRQAVSYKLKLIRGLDAQEFYHNTPRKD